MMKLPNVDRVISMKFPAYFIEAENHTTWLIHQYRQAYDLWGSDYGNLPPDCRGELVRDLIRSHDDEFFTRQKSLFTISSEVSRRLKEYNGVNAPRPRADQRGKKAIPSRGGDALSACERAPCRSRASGVASRSRSAAQHRGPAWS
jgi:hypothetical protein